MQISEAKISSPYFFPSLPCALFSLSQKAAYKEIAIVLNRLVLRKKSHIVFELVSCKLPVKIHLKKKKIMFSFVRFYSKLKKKILNEICIKMKNGKKKTKKKCPGLKRRKQKTSPSTFGIWHMISHITP